MFTRVKRLWNNLKAGTPGKRFQNEFRRRRANSRHTIFRKVGFVAAGLLLLVAGIFLLFVPGPGVLLLFIGGGLLARESFLAARMLDRLEVLLRNLLFWSLSQWESISSPLKVVVLLLALVLVGVFGFGAFKVLLATID
ncbi:MAG TPA: PGPGW domain-containing protein [Candidatus Binatia bacterium]|jgi:hypothetical protein